MAIRVATSDANQLLTAIRAGISSGAIQTWSVDSDGDFTHTPDQWRSKAWLRPRIDDKLLVLHILTPKGTKLGRATYAVYHGRFIEMLLDHLDQKFSAAVATAMPEAGDVVSAPA
jgi:hypothetical protein